MIVLGIRKFFVLIYILVFFIEVLKSLLSIRIIYRFYFILIDWIMFLWVCIGKKRERWGNKIDYVVIVINELFYFIVVERLFNIEVLEWVKWIRILFGEIICVFNYFMVVFMWVFFFVCFFVLYLMGCI